MKSDEVRSEFSETLFADSHSVSDGDAKFPKTEETRCFNGFSH